MLVFKSISLKIHPYNKIKIKIQIVRIDLITSLVSDTHRNKHTFSQFVLWSSYSPGFY